MDHRAPVEEGGSRRRSDDPSLADKACPFECEKCRLSEDRKKSSRLFGRYTKRMKDLTRMYYPAIPKRTTMEQIESERFMTTVVDIFIMGSISAGKRSVVIYLKYESEMTDKKKRNHFLTCIGMSSKEREKLIRTETGIFFWIPAELRLLWCRCNRGDMEHAGIYEG